jgi:tRNA1(Val) A37 N6-methylase TrmN6
LSTIEKKRLAISRQTDRGKKSHLGQFFTPERISMFMASLFSDTKSKACRLLDPGAGIGSLTTAFLDQCLSGRLDFNEINISAFEIDESLLHELTASIDAYRGQLPLRVQLYLTDYIEDAVFRLEFSHSERFTHAIINPPYKKIASKSRHRHLLRKVGIETGNLYSAFIALTLALMKTGGELVVIVPRSFCNGPYFKMFREYVLNKAAIRYIHLFRTRDRAFRDDAVLQENVIMMLERGGKQKNVRISFSSDDSFSDFEECEIPFHRVVLPDDPEKFIHIPISPEPEPLKTLEAIEFSLEDLGLSVSTGPVVDFRLKDQLREMPSKCSVPLLYPSHFRSDSIEWPIEGFKKPNAILNNEHTRRFLYPAGYYCVVRRLSSKEERKRIIASTVDPLKLPNVHYFGFENHLNVFHDNKHGIEEDLARGLTTYLNATIVDDYLRTFNGHTQVNATDLRKLKYPDRTTLMALGKWTRQHTSITQEMIDKRIRIALHEKAAT